MLFSSLEVSGVHIFSCIYAYVSYTCTYSRHVCICWNINVRYNMQLELVPNFGVHFCHHYTHTAAHGLMSVYKGKLVISWCVSEKVNTHWGRLRRIFFTPWAEITSTFDLTEMIMCKSFGKTLTKVHDCVHVNVSDSIHSVYMAYIQFVLFIYNVLVFKCEVMWLYQEIGNFSCAIFSCG